jgi:hypothetical protein
MPMTDILELISADFGEPVGKCLGRVDFSPDYYTEPDFYMRLRARMEETGTNRVPIEVEDDTLYNGHHRVYIAVELGFATMEATKQRLFSDDESSWRKVY